MNIKALIAKLKLPHTSGMHPSRDWLILLGLFAVLLGISIAWNTLFFFRVLSEENATGQAPVSSDTSALDHARTLFDERSQEAARYEAKYLFVDPSQ